MEADEANSPIALQVQYACHDTLPWLISFLLSGNHAFTAFKRKENQKMTAQGHE